MMQEALATVADGRDLTRPQARDVVHGIIRGEATDAQIGAFLIALRMKGEVAQEIAGCADALRCHAVEVRPRHSGLVDTAGTGGDGAGTLNLSTAAALVAASAGAKVAKHGNRAVSSLSGSADVLEALGFNLDLEPDAIATSIDELGFGFLFAPAHHPAMRRVRPVRNELATRTVFNVIGPLTNPAGARCHVIGVYAPELVDTLAEAVALLGIERALVVHGAGGIDELSPAGPNLVREIVDGDVNDSVVDPLDLGVPRCHPDDLAGGTPAHNARTIRAIFEGQDGAKRDAVLLNAGAALIVAGLATNLGDAYRAAADVVDSGAAAERLDQLIAFSRASASVRGMTRAS